MITKPCRKHPRYEGKHPPKTCLICWAIYRKVHGLVGHGPARERYNCPCGAPYRFDDKLRWCSDVERHQAWEATE